MDVVEVVVLEVEPDRKRISLSLKQVEPNPWEVIGEKYPIGSIIEGKIKNITDFGIFIGIDEGIDGLVHISDISWTKRFKHPSEVYKKGQTVQAKVLQSDKEHERFSLSIKELVSNPWETIDTRFPVGASVSGAITNISDFGLFVEIEEGIEGLIHISELSRDKEKMAALKVGDVIKAKVIHRILARTLPGTWNDGAERVALDINGTLLFVNQQHGLVPGRGIYLFGPGAAGQVQALRRVMQVPVELSPVPEATFYWPLEVLRLRPAHMPNFVSPDLANAPQRQVFAKVVAAAAIFAILASSAIFVYSHFQARQEEINIKFLTARLEKLQIEHQTLTRRNNQLASRQEMARLVVDDRVPPVPVWFLDRCRCLPDRPLEGRKGAQVERQVK